MSEKRKYRTSRTRSERIRSGRLRRRPEGQRPSPKEVLAGAWASLREASPRSLGASVGPLLSLALAAGATGLTLSAPLVPVAPVNPVRTQPLAAPNRDILLICPPAAGNGLEVIDYDQAQHASLLAVQEGATASFEGEALPAGSPQVQDFAEGGVLSVKHNGSSPAEGMGHAATLMEAGDLRGLATAACTAPRSTAWVIAGSTRPGSYAELRLSNPGNTTVTASVQAYGSTGPVDLPGGGQVAVPSGHTESVYLGTSSATSPDGRLAVHVTTDGGALGVYLVDETLDGETAAGMEVVSAGADPATEQVVPGVVLVEADKQGQATSGPLSSDQPVVRLVNPAEVPATVKVSLLGADGEQVLPGAESLTVDPGAVFDVSLAGVAPGTYALRTTSDQPVAAAVQLVRSAGEYPARSGALLHDRAWLQASTADLSLGADITLPRHWGLSPQLALANSSPQRRVVTLRAVGEEWSSQMVLEPGTTAVPEDLPETVTALTAVADGEGVHGAVVVTTEVTGETAGTLVSALPAVPGAQAQASRHVLLR